MLAATKPGATGLQLDAAARQVITDAGDAEPWHALGHTTGLWVHGVGVIFRSHRYELGQGPVAQRQGGLECLERRWHGSSLGR
jgi:Xaa-Pro aminopeptidase